MRAGGLYLAAAGFGVAWWVGYVGVLRFGPGRRVEVYDPLRGGWRVRWGLLRHDINCLFNEEKTLPKGEGQSIAALQLLARHHASRVYFKVARGVRYIICRSFSLH